MKKLISLLMVLTLMVGLFSCLGISAAAADYEFTFLVTSAAGVEDGDYSDIAAVRSSYIADRGDAMLVSVDAGSDAYGMYEAGYELAWADPYSLDNYFTGIYPDGGIYTSDYSGYQGTTWVSIGLPVGGSYADDEGYASVYFVAVGGESDAETLASFAEADGYVVAIGPWSAAEAVEDAADVDMFWTTDVDEDSLTELAEDGYMLGETLVVNADSTAETVAVVSIADGVISLEGLSVDISEETDTTGDDENYEDEDDTQDAEEEETAASTVTLMIDGYDSISWTQNSEEDPPSVTFEEVVEALHLYLGEDLLQTLAEGTDYVLSNESLTVTFTTDWLNSLFDNGIYELISEELTLTIVPEYAQDEDEEETETVTISLAEDADTSITWDADSSEALTVALSEGSTLAMVAVDGETLTEGTDYTYDSETRTVTFTTDWLNSLEEGEHTIVLCADDSGIAVIDEDSGSSNTVTLTLTVTKTSTAEASNSSDDTATATISTETTSASWDLGGTADLTITLDEGSTLTSVSVNGTELSTEYYSYDTTTLTLTIYAGYLNTLDAGEYTITLSSGDESAEIALTAVTVTEAISVTSTTAEWTLEGTDDLTITLGAAVTLESVTIDGTEVAESDAGYSYDGNVTVTIDATVLNGLTAGEHSIVLTDDVGNTVTVTLTVSEAEAEATATPSPTPTATATPTPTATPSYTYTWSRGSGSSLTVDLGKSVSKIDIYSGSTFYREATQGEDYTLSGTAITFSASMVNNSDGTAFWTDGTYHLIVTFTDGTTQDIYLALTDGVTSTATSTAEATATASAAPATSEGSSPDTGDTTNIGLYVVILIVLVIALAVVIIIVMKNKKQAEPERRYRPAQPEDEPEDDGMIEDYDVSDVDDDDNYPDE